MLEQRPGGRFGEVAPGLAEEVSSLETEVEELREQICGEALRLGFVAAGVARADPLPRGDFFRAWLRAGMAAGMGYLHRGAGERHQPRALFATAQSIIVVAASCAMDGPAPAGAENGRLAARLEEAPAGKGLLARFARGGDYHVVVRRRLERLAGTLEALARRPVRWRIAVDSAPILERELAVAAGLGFIGKNSMLIIPGIGSHTVLGALLVDIDLRPPAPRLARGCGRCTLCLEACPTGALRRPYLLDSRRCISYLTIEHRQVIEPALAAKIPPWLFGCDFCQTACPHNRGAGPRRSSRDPELAPRDALGSLDLISLLTLRSGDYKRLVRGRSLARVSRATLRRNAAIVAAGGALAGEGGSSECRELIALLEAATRDPQPAVAAAASWALAQRQSPQKGG